MKEAIIYCSEFKDDWTLRRQVESICKEAERLEDVVVVEIPGTTDYDLLDEAIETTLGSGIYSLTILHEDNLDYERFEQACLKEYGRRALKIDILPKRSSRQIREAGGPALALAGVGADTSAEGRVLAFTANQFLGLREAETVAATAGTGAPADSKPGKNAKVGNLYVIIPFNAQVAGTFKAMNAFANSAAGKLLAQNKEAIPIIYQPESIRFQSYQMIPEESLKFFKGGKDFSATWFNGRLQKISDDKAFSNLLTTSGLTAANLVFHYPDTLAGAMKDFLRIFQKAQCLQYNVGHPDLSKSGSLFQIASQISADIQKKTDKNAKPDPKQIEKYYGEKQKNDQRNLNMLKHAAFMVTEAKVNREQYKAKNISAKTRDSQFKNILAEFYKGLGMDKDVAAAKNKLEDGGFGLATGLATSIKNAMSKAAKNNKDKDKKQDDALDGEMKQIIAHAKFPELLKAIDSIDCFDTQADGEK